MSSRYYLAVHPPTHVQQAIYGFTRGLIPAREAIHARLNDASTYHVTLRFLGKMHGDVLNDIMFGLNAEAFGHPLTATVAFTPQEFRFQWDHPESVLYLPVTGLDALAEQVRSLVGSIAGVVHTPEDWTGHVTIAKGLIKSDWLGHGQGGGLSWDVKSIDLVRSARPRGRLRPWRPARVIARIPLQPLSGSEANP